MHSHCFHHLILWLLVKLQQCISVRVPLYAYVPHWTVLKQFKYVHYGCGKQWKVVYSLERASTGSVPSEDRSVTGSVTSTQKMWTSAAPLVRKWSFFSTKLYRDHTESYLSELGYSELVQRQFEKMAFFSCGPPTDDDDGHHHHCRRRTSPQWDCCHPLSLPHSP